MVPGGGGHSESSWQAMEPRHWRKTKAKKIPHPALFEWRWMGILFFYYILHDGKSTYLDRVSPPHFLNILSDLVVVGNITRFELIIIWRNNFWLVAETIVDSYGASRLWAEGTQWLFSLSCKEEHRKGVPSVDDTSSTGGRGGFGRTVNPRILDSKVVKKRKLSERMEHCWLLGQVESNSVLFSTPLAMRV